MNRLLIAVIGVSAVCGFASPSQSAVPPEVRDQCMKAVDFLGCVKAMTGALESPAGSGGVLRIDQTTRPGLLSEMGNSCPGGWAYSGAGKCRSTKCVPMGIFGKNEPVLAGKGISCKGRNLDYGVIGGRASLRWGDSFENASNDPKCPAFEPDYGDPNSCITAQRTGKNISTGIIVKRSNSGDLVVEKCLGPCKIAVADVMAGDVAISRDGIPIANLPKKALKEGQIYSFVLRRNGREHSVSLAAEIMQYDGWIHAHFKKGETKKKEKDNNSMRSPRDRS